MTKQDVGVLFYCGANAFQGWGQCVPCPDHLDVMVLGHEINDHRFALKSWSQNKGKQIVLKNVTSEF